MKACVCPSCRSSVRPRRAVDENDRATNVCPVCGEQLDGAPLSPGSQAPRLAGTVTAIVLLLAIGVPTLLWLASRHSKAKAAEMLVARCNEIGARLKSIAHPARLEKRDAAGMMNVLSGIEKALEQIRGIEVEAKGLPLGEDRIRMISDLLLRAYASYGLAADAATGLADRKPAELAVKIESVEEVEVLLKMLARLTKRLDACARSTADDPKTSESLAAAGKAVTACRDKILRVEPVTFDALMSRLSSGERPVGVVEIEAWRSDRHRFLFTAKTYETSQYTFTTHTRVEEQIVYSLFLRDGPGETYGRTWRALGGELVALRGDVARAKEEGELSDDEVEAFAGRTQKLAGRVDANVDAPPAQCLVLQMPDASDFDDENATTLAEEGSKPFSPWDVSSTILDSTFANSAFGSTLFQIEAAIKRLEAMAEKPVNLDETLPEATPPNDILRFGATVDRYERLSAKYNVYAELYNVELRRRTRLQLDSWIIQLGETLAEAAPEKVSVRVTLRCRAIDMPDIVRKGIAKAIGREPVPFVLIEAAGKPGK